MLFSFFYEIVLWMLSLVAFPKMLYHRFKHGKYRESLGKRLGVGFPIIKKGNRSLVWIHAVSVGEAKAVAPLVKMLKAKMENPIIVVSSVTETGHAEVQRSIPQADYKVYLPFDFRFIIRSIVRSVKPDIVILSESDFWYNFLKSAKELGAKIILVNGKISSTSMQRFKKFSMLSKRLFGLIDLLCVQSEHYSKRFLEIGVPAEKITITGNLKFDGEYPKLSDDQLKIWKQQLGIEKGDQVLVIGSSHDPEEKMFLEVSQKLWIKFPRLKVVFVPRHPERFNEVAGILHAYNIPFIRFSQLGGNFYHDQRVILMDAMGLLRKCYQFADVAVVAGSYTSKVGGHNILEPSWYGVPVVFGPYMHSQPELVELVNHYGAGMQISKDRLHAELEKLLSCAETRGKIGESGLAMVAGINGATKRTLDILSPYTRAKTRR